MMGSNFLRSVHHDGSRRYVEPQSARLGSEVTIRLRAHPLTPLERVLARNYGFADEELDFINNYDVKYRMGKDEDKDKG